MSQDAEGPEIPASLIKLERLRTKAYAIHAVNRVLQERVSELTDRIKWFTDRNRDLEASDQYRGRTHSAPGTRYPRDHIEANTRTIAALTAMREVAQAAIDGNESKQDEARLYDSMRKHLLGELLAWGIE